MDAQQQTSMLALEYRLDPSHHQCLRKRGGRPDSMHVARLGNADLFNEDVVGSQPVVVLACVDRRAVVDWEAAARLGYDCRHLDEVRTFSCDIDYPHDDAQPGDMRRLAPNSFMIHGSQERTRSGGG